MGCLDDSAVSNLLEGLLPDEERQAVQAHLDACEDCRAVYVTAATAQPEETAGESTGDEPRETPPAPVAELKPGVTVGRYLVVERAGAGGMGEVWAAYDPELDRKVALKILLPAGPGEGILGEVRRLLAREAKTMARLSHPNVISIFDVGTYGDRLFIAMELVEGGTLAQWLRARERPWKEVLSAFVEAGRGLAAAHAAGIVHRDFKPANVLLDGAGHARVTDFGLARLVAPEPTPEAATGREQALPRDRAQPPELGRTTRTGILVGTPAYMAPEQLRGHPADARSDLFSYCVALYEALYRKHPFAGRTVEELREAVLKGQIDEAPPRSKVPGWVRRALLRGLRPSPEERFPSMDALLATLAREPVRRRRWLLAGATAAVSAAMVTLLLLRSAPGHLECAAAPSRLVGTWDAPRRQAIARSFRATGVPFAGDAWQRVEGALSDYSRGWARAYRDACEATWVRHEQSTATLDLRMGCLNDRLLALRATTELLSRADAKMVRRAVRIAQSLPSLSPCAARAVLGAAPPPGLAQLAAVKALRERLIQASALRRVGRYREARPVALAAVAGAKQVGYRPLLAEALLELGDLESDLGRPAKAEDLLRRAHLIAQACRHDRVAAAALVSLVAVVGYLRADAKGGREWGALAAAAIERIGGAPWLESELENNLGRIAYLRSELAPALARYRRAAEIVRKQGGKDHWRLAVLLSNIGGVLHRQGRYDEAVRSLERALAIARRALGPRHPTVATRMANLGFVLGGLYRFKRAIPLLEQALKIEEKVYGAQSAMLWSTLEQLGSQLLYSGDLPRAEAVLTRALAAVEKAHGRDDSRVARALSDLGQVLLHRAAYRRAIACFRRAGEIFRKRLGPEALGLAYADVGIGMVRFGQGRTGEALREYRRALQLREKKLGPAHPEVATALHYVGDALLSQGKLGEALAVYERSRVIREKALGPQEPDLAESLMGVAEVHLARGDPRRARPLLERALAIFERRPGDPQAVARTRYAAARALWLTGGEHARARGLAETAAAAYARIPHYARQLAAVRAWLRRHR